jgi:hypothetical protein
VFEICADPSGRAVFGRSLTRIMGSNPTGGVWMSVSCECCVLSGRGLCDELVQRSPTDCGVSQVCVIMKPRRNEEAQAHIGISSHRERKKKKKVV